MQIIVEKTSDLGRKIKVAIPATKINELVSNKIKKLSNQVKLNGFRPGHVPIKLINEKYGTEVRKEVLSEAIDAGLNQALSENQLYPVGEISLEQVKDETNNTDIECVFTLEVYPEIKFDNDFLNLQINTPKVEITEQDIDNSLVTLRQQLGKKIIVENRTAKTGDFLTIDFIGFIDGKEFPDNQGKDTIVEIGSEQFIDGFESGLVGTKAGETVELKLQFPTDYAENSLASKPVTFNITVKQIEEKPLAELNEEFAKSLGIQDNDVSQIRSKIKSNMEKYIVQITIEKEREQLSELLLKTYPIELPNKLLIEEQQHLERLFKQRNQEQGINIKELNVQTITELKEQAYKNVHLSLLLREVIKINNLQPNENLLNQKLKELSFLFQNKLSTTKYKNIYNNMKNSIINSMLTNTAIDFIIAKVTKTELLLSFEELNKS
jgi:trigger factor